MLIVKKAAMKESGRNIMVTVVNTMIVWTVESEKH
jgi:hypothetical protein